MQQSSFVDNEGGYQPKASQICEWPPGTHPRDSYKTERGSCSWIRPDNCGRREVACDNTFRDNIRQRAQERVQENKEHRAGLENNRKGLKAIFHKYRALRYWAAIVLAVGTTTGVIIDVLRIGLKSVASGVGNGLNGLGRKVTSMLAVS